MTRPILFDLDGVLADSRRPIIDSVNGALAVFGLPPRSDAEVAQIIGPPTEIGFGELLDVAPDDPFVDRAVAEYRALYADALHDTRPYPGVQETIAQLGGPLGVATSKPRRYALPVLDAIGLGDAFDFVAGPEPGGPNDKHSMIAEALEQLPGAAAHVGDRMYDVVAAQQHGLHAIAVTWGFGSREELAEADEMVDDAISLLTAAQRARNS